MDVHKKRIILGISGASGIPLAHMLLTLLNELDVHIHLILSEGAKRVIEHESSLSEEGLLELAHAHYPGDDMAAGPASGSWQHDGMIICPCSMNTLACIANGITSNLLQRCADVSLKEARPLIIVPRETPLSSIHLQNMLTLSQNGARIMPFCPAFYTEQTNVQFMLTQFCGRILDQLHFEHSFCDRWKNNS